MDLVNQLQESAEKDDVLTVLRKARRLASKLGVRDIDGWLKAEQNGYASPDEVPEYRKVSASVVFNTNGYVPMGMGMLGNGTMDYPGACGVTSLSMQDAMPEVLVLIGRVDEGQHICHSIDDTRVVVH